MGSRSFIISLQANLISINARYVKKEREREREGWEEKVYQNNVDGIGSLSCRKSNGMDFGERDQVTQARVQLDN